MTMCIKCGVEAEGCLCDACCESVELEKLCAEIVACRPQSVIRHVFFLKPKLSASN